MRLLICAGGTGGGVYPAMAVLQALNAKHPKLDVLWVGGEGGMEADLVGRAGIPFASIPAAGLHGVGLRVLPRNLTLLVRGVLAARKLLKQFHPDVLFFTGGYVAGPMAFAGRQIPTLLYVPDIEPGLALKSLARFADRIAVSAEDSRKYFDKNVIVTGYPFRSELTGWDGEKGRRSLGLEPLLPVLLVFGGSKGAHSINQTILTHLPDLLKMTQIIHISGQADWSTVEAAQAHLSPEIRKNYHAYPYLHDEMGAALAAADLVVARSGASCLGEFPYFGLPAVLIPYPYAWRYQKVNADYLAQRGAAVMIKDERLDAELLPVVRDLLRNPSKREAMSAAMKSLAHPQAAQAIAKQLLELGGERP